MKIQELRQLAASAERAHVEKAFSEVYKQLPKHKKEEIDPVIQDILTGKDISISKKKTPVDFTSLKQEIQVFMKNAYDQNYFAPNRIIPKSQRPKWRFLVKGYIRELEKISLEDEHYPEAAGLLKQLYCLICYACNYYLFSSDDPFRSIGIPQDDFFHSVVKRTLGTGYTGENLSELLLLASTSGLSRESLHAEQQLVLLAELKTSDAKYMAVEEAKKIIQDKKAKLTGLKKYDSKRYHLEEAVNNLCKMILMIQIALAEPEDGIHYFFRTCAESDQEITLYRALDVVRWIDDENDALWRQIYEYGIQKKIKPRESLVREYEARCEQHA